MVTGQAVCRRLWCTAPLWDHHQQCHTQHMPWADGTSCGADKWCHRGECVSRRNLEPVDGQWGEWGRYGECSRTCGGGVKRKYRECDNPAPKNGGNYCVGERVKYRSCGIRECPPGSPDFRYTSTCYAREKWELVKILANLDAMRNVSLPFLSLVEKKVVCSSPQNHFLRIDESTRA